jgi:hypothetical protein
MQNSGMGFTRTFAGQSIPVWQRDKALELVQGGFVLQGTFIGGTIIPAGTPLVFNEATRTATLLHTAVVYANASNTATAYQINKNSNLIVGDYLAVVPGGAAEAITAIDTSNPLYDSVTVGTTLGVAVTAGEFAFASTATGASAAALPAINGLLYEETQVPANIINSEDTVQGSYIPACSVVIRGTVYARRVPYSTALAALLPHIIYSQSY